MSLSTITKTARFAIATDEYKAMASVQLNQDDLDLYLSLVLDTDTPQSVRAYPQIVANFEQGRSNKGHSFPAFSRQGLRVTAFRGRTL